MTQIFKQENVSRVSLEDAFVHSYEPPAPPAIVPGPDKLIVGIEDGSLYYERHEGTWLVEGLYNYLIDCFSEEIEGLASENKDVAEAIRASIDESKVFLVTIMNPSMGEEPGGWGNWGWEPPCVYLDWSGPITITEEKYVPRDKKGDCREQESNRDRPPEN